MQMTAVVGQQLVPLVQPEDQQHRDGSFRVPALCADRPHPIIITTVNVVLQARSSEKLSQQLVDLMGTCMTVVADWKRTGHQDSCQCMRCAGTRKMELQVQRLQSEHRGTRDVDRIARHSQGPSKDSGPC